ncbi:DUF397 domain-containing protein [Streptomyces albofaciens JCM 4342]|nr:DUF397 domain-containing protein [Streptomyces albofaciens]KAA6214261.1 DUF397 domain-containing protein [Streptomyces albofaciens JCM 4342]
MPVSPFYWQKSSYSSEGNNCLELAVGADGGVLVRENDDPSIAVAASTAAIGGLLRATRGDLIVYADGTPETTQRVTSDVAIEADGHAGTGGGVLRRGASVCAGRRCGPASASGAA